MGIETAVIAGALLAGHTIEQSNQARRLQSQAENGARIDQEHALIKAQTESEAKKDEAAAKALRQRRSIAGNQAQGMIGGIGGGPKYAGDTLLGGSSPTDPKAAVLGA